MLLGSGELGKEFVISAQRYGLDIVAVDSYADAPAMHVADEFEVIDWPQIFGVKPTTFKDAITETFSHPKYSKIVLEF